MTRFAPALLVFAALAPAAPVPKAAPKAAPYPTAVGTKWEYVRDGDPNVVCVEEIAKAEEKDGAIRIRVDVAQPDGTKTYEEFDIKDGEVWCRVSAGTPVDPPALSWKGGSKEGDTWVNETAIGRVTIKRTVTVGKAEEITTPAGKFTATPLAIVVTEPKGAPAYTAWYVSGVGLIRHTFDGAKEPYQELKAFTPGKK